MRTRMAHGEAGEARSLRPLDLVLERTPVRVALLPLILFAMLEFLLRYLHHLMDTGKISFHLR